MFLSYYSFKGCGKLLSEVHVILRSGQSFCAGPIAHMQILRSGPQPKSRFCAMAHSAKTGSVLIPTAHNQVLLNVHNAEPNYTWKIAVH
jgi:hypothetical protein